MKLRYISYGYQLSSGNIVPNDVEAELVRLIFRKYIDGESYNQIVSTLVETGCPYSETASGWNKNMVGRILKNIRYTGKDGYPRLITDEEFKQSLALQQLKQTNRSISMPSEVAALKGKVACEECGCSYERYFYSRVGERWNCKNTKCICNIKITDAILTEQITSLLNIVINNQQIIKIPSIKMENSNLETTKLTNEINRELEKSDCNQEHIKALIMARASAQYALCSDGLITRKAHDIQKYLENHVPIKGFNIDLFESVVDKVIVREDGTVYLILKNGQVLGNNLERSDMP